MTKKHRDFDCSTCDYYNKEENTCGAFECNGFDCPELPCEKVGAEDEREIE